jgi:uncharacterized protein YjbJ (UPF0337 family)
MENFMDKNRIKGAADQTKGSIKKAVGKLTGSRKTEAEGQAQKLKGKTETAVGKAKDARRR